MDLSSSFRQSRGKSSRTTPYPNSKTYYVVLEATVRATKQSFIHMQQKSNEQPDLSDNKPSELVGSRNLLHPPMNIKQGIDLNRSEIVIYNTYTFINFFKFQVKKVFSINYISAKWRTNQSSKSGAQISYSIPNFSCSASKQL